MGVLTNAYGSLGRAQARHSPAFIGVGVLVAIILAAVGNEDMQWKTSITDLWIASGTRVAEETKWLDSSEIDASSHFETEALITEKVDEKEKPTNKNAFDVDGMMAHQRQVNVIMSTEVDYTFKRVVGGQPKEFKETFNYNDFCRNLYPYAFQCMRASVLDCFKEVRSSVLLF